MSPATIEGSPSSTSTMKPTAAPTRRITRPPLAAASLMKSATRIPSGAEKSVASPIRMSVPTRALEMPPVE